MIHILRTSQHGGFSKTVFFSKSSIMHVFQFNFFSFQRYNAVILSQKFKLYYLILINVPNDLSFALIICFIIISTTHLKPEICLIMINAFSLETYKTTCYDEL